MAKESIVVSRTVWVITLFTIAVLLAIVVYLLAKPRPVETSDIASELAELSEQFKSDTPLLVDRSKVPIPPELTNYLRAQGFVSIAFINQLGQLKLVSPAGTPKSPCGKREGAKLPEECHVKLVEPAYTQITLFRGITNPQCLWADVGGTVVNLGHATDRPGRWSMGQDPCHRGGPDVHHFD